MNSLQIDAQLVPYVQATSETDSDRLLSALVSECIGPVIKQVIRSKLRVYLDHEGRSSNNPDAEDLYSATLLQLLTRLKECKASPNDKSIGNLRSYVAVISYHTCYEYLRFKYPQRYNLKNKLRYLLTHQSGLALWENESGDLVGGFTEWQRGQTKVAAHSHRLQQLQNDPRTAMQSALPQGDFRRANQADLAAAIFNHTGHPIGLDELVDILADLLGIKDRAEPATRDEEADPLASVAQQGADVAAELDNRFFLKWVWEEICQLPVRQRTALLLNLRDAQGGGVAALLPVTGIASLRQIAAALEMVGEDFAQLWPKLPLDDASIAGLLSVTRQQVINLRKCARERLARRMKAIH